MMGSLRLHVFDSLAQLDPGEWDRLAGDSPFLAHAFLSGLEETACVCADSGWQPCHLTLWDGAALCAAMPLYLKTHSWGEYVFDWSWAEAFHKHGLRYYPKLVCAVPFTPATGPRLLAPSAALQEQLLDAAFDLARDVGASSLHVLFPPPDQAALLEARGLMLRSTVQFHWENPGYDSFEAFLATMGHDKRKKIRQERRKVREAGIAFRWLDGHSATEGDWDFFTWCYNRTYRQHHSTPYLNRAFFRHLARRMPEQVLLVIGARGDRPVACALNIHNHHTLYGRYWGAAEFHSGLHFETCYYQAIEFCIARGLRCFEGGAQGEHKLARGLLPTRTLSAHWLAHPQFARAVESFLEREGRGVGAYLDELSEHSPFRQPPA